MDQEAANEPQQKKTGIVKFYNKQKGFGFIVMDDTHRRILVNEDGLIDEIEEDDRVEFEMERGPKGYFAVRVKRKNR